MGEKLRVAQVFVLCVIILSLSTPAIASLFATNPGESLLAQHQTSKDGFEKLSNSVNLRSSSLSAWESQNIRLGLQPKLEKQLNWVPISDHLVAQSGDTHMAIPALSRTQPASYEHIVPKKANHIDLPLSSPKKRTQGNREVVFDKTVQAHKSNAEATDTWGPVPLPIALLFFGTSILGILCVRRKDPSNMT